MGLNYRPNDMEEIKQGNVQGNSHGNNPMVGTKKCPELEPVNREEENSLRKTLNAQLIPEVSSRLRHNILRVPELIRTASGIVIFGRRIKSLVFTTDLAIIRNCDADAVLAVYPFTPQQAISDALIKYSYIPVFAGVGGGLTRGLRTKTLALDVEGQGAFGVVLNSPIPNEDVEEVYKDIDIPIVVTVVSDKADVASRIKAGASIINVAGAAETPAIVAKIRKDFPDLPIIASGGNTEESIRQTIEAGANAITYTPPSVGELFKGNMKKYREIEGRSE